MELTILHLYPDAMSLYGEYANVAILCRHLAAMGVQTSVQAAASGDEPNFGAADLIYMGAGTERRQKNVLTAAERVGPLLRAAADGGAVLLFTGNAMETLGASVTDAKGVVWPGFALAGFTSVETDQRTPGDVVALSDLWESPVVGFMNKCSTTSGITAPLFHSLQLGFGNDTEGGPEGYVSGNVFATHITGPVLVKNPDFLDLIVRRLFLRRGWPLPEQLPVLPHEREAYAVTLRELQARIGK